MRLVVALVAALALGVVGASRATGQAAAPLPDAATFMAAARARVALAAADFTRFSHRERYIEVGFNPFGNLGTGPSVLAEVFPSADDGLTYRRILERSGKPVKDLDEQDRKYRARLEAHRRALLGAPVDSRTATEKVDMIDRARQEANVRSTLNLFTFTIESRTQWAGEPAIVVRFVPKPGLEPESREARVAYAFTGRVWVHEKDYDVMHVEAEAIDDVSFGYGLVGRLHKGCKVAFTRQRVHGTWLPALTVFKGSARVLFRWAEIDFRREYFDYQPYVPTDLPARLGWPTK